MEGDSYAHGYKLNGLRLHGTHYGEAWSGKVYSAEPSWSDGVYNGVHLFVRLDAPLPDGRTELALLDMVPQAPGCWANRRATQVAEVHSPAE